MKIFTRYFYYLIITAPTNAFENNTKHSPFHEKFASSNIKQSQHSPAFDNKNTRKATKDLTNLIKFCRWLHLEWINQYSCRSNSRMDPFAKANRIKGFDQKFRDSLTRFCLFGKNVFLQCRKQSTDDRNYV